MEFSSASASSTCFLHCLWVLLYMAASAVTWSLAASWGEPAFSGRNFFSPGISATHHPGNCCWRTLLCWWSENLMFLCAFPNTTWSIEKGMFSSYRRVSAQTPICCGVPGREEPCQLHWRSMHSHFWRCRRRNPGNLLTAKLLATLVLPLYEYSTPRNRQTVGTAPEQHFFFKYLDVCWTFLIIRLHTTCTPAFFCFILIWRQVSRKTEVPQTLLMDKDQLSFLCVFFFLSFYHVSGFSSHSLETGWFSWRETFQ